MLKASLSQFSPVIFYFRFFIFLRRKKCVFQKNRKTVSQKQNTPYSRWSANLCQIRFAFFSNDPIKLSICYQFVCELALLLSLILLLLLLLLLYKFTALFYLIYYVE